MVRTVWGSPFYCGVCIAKTKDDWSGVLWALGFKGVQIRLKNHVRLNFRYLNKAGFDFILVFILPL